MTINKEERAFFAGFGERVAQLRKERGITQVQLAQTLNVSQQTIQAYEVGRRRIPVSTLRVLAKTLGVTTEALLGRQDATPRKRGPAPQIQQHLERISQLPKPKQKMLMKMIDAVLAQQGR